LQSHTIIAEGNVFLHNSAMEKGGAIYIDNSGFAKIWILHNFFDFN